MKTIINAVQSWTKKEIKNSTADWSQNDASAVDYVKNRTHWSDGVVEEVVLERQTVGLSDIVDCEIIVGQTYEVLWDNKAYHCVAWGNGSSVIGLGEGGFMDIDAGETVPFLIYNNKIRCKSGTTHTISITTTVENIHKLDSKYLDLPTNLATTDDVEGAKQEALDVANNAQTTANNAQTTANNKMDATNPVGTGSFSMNRKSGTTVGTNSVALGYNTTASGKYSYAEGCGTITHSSYQHVQGKYNIHEYIKTNIMSGTPILCSKTATFYVSKEYSFDKTSGLYTLINPIAITAADYQEYLGYYIPIDTTVSNNVYEAKLVNDVTESMQLAVIDYQLSNHNSSYYKIINQLSVLASTNEIYAHIVGNGTSSARSNAHTIDWNGVGWFQGGLQVGGNAQDGEGVGYVPAVPAGAQVGQILAVKAVDENGKPTEWGLVTISLTTDENGVMSITTT